MARINDQTPLATVVEIMEPGNALKSKRFSITGHLGRVRNEMIRIIEECGGIFDKEPVWGTHYLLTNKDWTANSVKGKSNKLKKAEEMGIKIISEATFYEMIMANAQDSITNTDS